MQREQHRVRPPRRRWRLRVSLRPVAFCERRRGTSQVTRPSCPALAPRPVCRSDSRCVKCRSWSWPSSSRSSNLACSGTHIPMTVESVRSNGSSLRFFSLSRSIREREFLNLNWKRTEHKRNARHIVKMVERFNKVICPSRSLFSPRPFLRLIPSVFTAGELLGGNTNCARDRPQAALFTPEAIHYSCRGTHPLLLHTTALWLNSI